LGFKFCNLSDAFAQLRAHSIDHFGGTLDAIFGGGGDF
jgi:hypothetical protein